jgi:hypothetical protein
MEASSFYRIRHGFGGKAPALFPASRGADAFRTRNRQIRLPPKFAAITGNAEVGWSNPLMRRARSQVSKWTMDDH